MPTDNGEDAYDGEASEANEGEEQDDDQPEEEAASVTQSSTAESTAAPKARQRSAAEVNMQLKIEALEQEHCGKYTPDVTKITSGCHIPM